MRAFPDTFAIIDTETTGMRPSYSRVVDIGIIRVEQGVVVDRFETLLNPGTYIPSSISRFTGITDADVATAPPFEEVALRVQELLAGAVFVAHNASFDYGFIASEFKRIGMAFSADTLCSVQLSRALYPKQRHHNLDAIIERFGLSAGQRHRAMPDAEAVLSFFQVLSQEHAEETVREAIGRIRDRAAQKLAKGSFAPLPSGAGVYMFYGEEGELLYVGKSKHVRTRARSHFSPSARSQEGAKAARLQEETAQIRTQETSGELSALLLEAALVKSEAPLYNRALRKRKTLVTAHRLTDERGYTRIELRRVAELSPSEDILGVFRTTTQAKGVLRTLAKEHALCQKLLGIEQGTGACFGMQLGTCQGACIGGEEASAYGERLDQAFESRRLRTWPYRGAILITEQKSEEEGSVFLIDDWMLQSAYRYEGDAFSPLLPSQDAFDYDTYKILVRYLKAPKNKRSVRVLSASKKQAFLAQIGEDAEIAYDPS